MISNCPGSQKFKQPQPEVIKCPSCSGEVEIWTDEVQANCPKCKIKVSRQAGESCLDWCGYAKECVGEILYSKHTKNKSLTVKEKLLKELENYFGSDKKRIDHAKSVMHFSEEILKKERGDWHIVIPASILHDIGIKEAERKYGSTAGKYQEKEGPALARKFLLKMELKKEDIDQICEIVAHHHSPGKIDTQNFKILYDADWIVNIKEEVSLEDKVKLKETIDKVFLTRRGKEIAKEVYLQKGGES